MNFDFKDKKILVTGAAGALGSVVSDKAQENGASLILMDISVPENSSDSDKWIKVDLGDAGSVAEALAEIANVDVIFHVAGGFDMGPMVHETSEDFFPE